MRKTAICCADIRVTTTAVVMIVDWKWTDGSTGWLIYCPSRMETANSWLLSRTILCEISATAEVDVSVSASAVGVVVSFKAIWENL